MGSSRVVLYVVLVLSLLNSLAIFGIASFVYIAYSRADPTGMVTHTLSQAMSDPTFVERLHNSTDAVSGRLIQTLGQLLDPWPVDAVQLVNYVLHSDISAAATGLGRLGERLVVALNESSVIPHQTYYWRPSFLQIFYTVTQVIQIIGDIEYLQPVPYQPQSLLGVLAQALLNSTNSTDGPVSPQQQYELGVTCVSLAQRVGEANWSWWAFQGMQHVDVNVGVKQVVNDIVQVCQNIANSEKEQLGMVALNTKLA